VLYGAASSDLSVYSTNGSWDTAYGSSLTLNVNNGAQISLFGGSDTAYGAANSDLSIYNTSSSADKVSGSNMTLNLTSNTQASLSGSSDSVYGASGATLTESSSGNTFGGSGYTVDLGASNLTLTDNAANLSVIDQSGISGGVINLGANIAAVDTTGSNFTFNLGANDDATSFTIAGAAGSSDTINWNTALNNGLANFDSSTFVLAPNSTESSLEKDWTGVGGTGTEVDQLINNTSGTSQTTYYDLQQSDPGAGLNSATVTYDEQWGQGEWTTSVYNFTNGDTGDATADWVNGQYTGQTIDYYDGSVSLGYADFNSAGQVTVDDSTFDGTYDPGDDSGDLGDSGGGDDEAVPHSGGTSGGAPALPHISISASRAASGSSSIVARTTLAPRYGGSGNMSDAGGLSGASQQSGRTSFSDWAHLIGATAGHAIDVLPLDADVPALLRTMIPAGYAAAHAGLG